MFHSLSVGKPVALDMCRCIPVSKAHMGWAHACWPICCFHQKIWLLPVNHAGCLLVNAGEAMDAFIEDLE